MTESTRRSKAKAVPATVFDANGHVQLDSRETMWQVLDELFEKDPARYHGHVSLSYDGAPLPVLEITDEQSANVGTPDIAGAVISDHIVMPYGRLMKLTDAEFLAATPGGS